MVDVYYKDYLSDQISCLITRNSVPRAYFSMAALSQIIISSPSVRHLPNYYKKKNNLTSLKLFIAN